jgi:hypothetical protein
LGSPVSYIPVQTVTGETIYDSEDRKITLLK